MSLCQRYRERKCIKCIVVVMLIIPLCVLLRRDIESAFIRWRRHIIRPANAISLPSNKTNTPGTTVKTDIVKVSQLAKEIAPPTLELVPERNRFEKLARIRKKLDDESEGSFYQVSDNIYLYSGFVDRRFNSIVVRLIGMQNKDITTNITCRFRRYNITTSDAKKADVVDVLTTSFPIYPNWPSVKSRYHAYLYVCLTPCDWYDNHTKHVVKFSVVSVCGKYETNMNLFDNEVYDSKIKNDEAQRRRSDSTRNSLTNSLTEMENGDAERTSDQVNDAVRRVRKQKQDILVCVKAVYGRPSATKLAEWIEINRELGVNKIIFYDVASLGDGRRVLEYYASTGYIDIVPFHYALQMRTVLKDDPHKVYYVHGPLLEDEQSYLVSLNDCFYRQRTHFRYIMIIDWDEVIIPVREGDNLVTLADQGSREFPDAVALMMPTAWHFDKFNDSDDSATARTTIPTSKDTKKKKVPTATLR